MIPKTCTRVSNFWVKNSTIHDTSLYSRKKENVDVQEQRCLWRSECRDEDGFQLVQRRRRFGRQHINNKLVQIEAKVFDLKEYRNPNGNALQGTERRSQLSRMIILTQAALPWMRQIRNDASTLQLIAKSRWFNRPTGQSFQAQLLSNPKCRFICFFKTLQVGRTATICISEGFRNSG